MIVFTQNENKKIENYNKEHNQYICNESFDRCYANGYYNKEKFILNVSYYISFNNKNITYYLYFIKNDRIAIFYKIQEKHFYYSTNNFSFCECEQFTKKMSEFLKTLDENNLIIDSFYNALKEYFYIDKDKMLIKFYTMEDEIKNLKKVIENLKDDISQIQYELSGNANIINY